jgi:hypothetical protein
MTPSKDHIDMLVERAIGLHDKLANCHPSLRRGQVWCRHCGAAMRVDSADCLRSGWPKCCGYTMTIDSPEERASRARAQGGQQ